MILKWIYRFNVFVFCLGLGILMFMTKYEDDDGVHHFPSVRVHKIFRFAIGLCATPFVFNICYAIATIIKVLVR